QGVDHDWSQAGINLAELLDLPHVPAVVSLEANTESKRGKAKREVEGGAEVVEFSLPAVITAQKGLNEPRYASLKGIMAVKKKVIPEWTLADLGVDPAAVSESAASVRFVEFSLPPPREKGRILEGEPVETARELVRILREEAKVL
ncbi:MAG: electron transfer flavoprotein subunit beta, partial [Candidatus Eisenbacteria bacterium]